MKTWQIILQLMRWRPVVYGFMLLLSVIEIVLPIVAGLLMQRFFDGLGGSGSRGVGLWDVLAVLVALEVARVLSNDALLLSLVTFYNSGYALLRRNLLRQLLHHTRDIFFHLGHLLGVRTHARSAISQQHQGIVGRRVPIHREAVVTPLRAALQHSA